MLAPLLQLTVDNGQLTIGNGDSLPNERRLSPFYGKKEHVAEPRIQRGGSKVFLPLLLLLYRANITAILRLNYVCVTYCNLLPETVSQQLASLPL